jgi:hypothetical protein
MSAIGYLATTIRFVFKLFIAQVDLAHDDYLLLLTVLVCIPGHVMQEIGTIVSYADSVCSRLSPVFVIEDPRKPRLT